MYPGNPNDEFCAATAARSKQQLAVDAAAAQLDEAMYGELGPESQAPSAGVPRGTITSHLRWRGSAVT
eukprot:SAG31_NODE_1341_length_8708_cov_10.945174_10_plen_68_part_00